MGWWETRGRDGAMGIETRRRIISSTRDAPGRDVACGLCEQAHGSVMVVIAMMMKPEVPKVTMMLTIVMMMVAAAPAVSVEHSRVYVPVSDGRPVCISAMATGERRRCENGNREQRGGWLELPHL